MIAQQGHPLVGTWSGYWGETPDDKHRVLLLLDYEGDEISGVINPGPNPAPLTNATLDPKTWTVRLEGSRQDDDGNVIRYLIVGRIENVTSSVERSITGTWIEGDASGDFQVVMN